MANEKINKDAEVAAKLKANSQRAAAELLALTVDQLEQVIEFQKKKG